MRVELSGADLVLVEGDITEQDTDAIVNAANQTLLGGGGVDGAIHHAGGPAILEECRKLGGCGTGDAKITTGGRLRARFVIHTVGPVYRQEEEARCADLLASAYRRSLEVAAENGLESVAFPSISTGAFGYPVKAAAHVALRSVIASLEGGLAPGVRLVRFVLFGRAALGVYERELAELMAGRAKGARGRRSDGCR